MNIINNNFIAYVQDFIPISRMITRAWKKEKEKDGRQQVVYQQKRWSFALKRTKCRTKENKEEKNLNKQIVV